MKSWVTSFTQKGKCLKVSMTYCLSSTLVDLNYTNIFPPHFTYSFNICRAAHSFLWLIQFSFLCFYSSAFSSTYVFIFMIQALKNIAAISLAISYPNKSTQLLNMSPWERHTQEEGTAYSSRGVGCGGGGRTHPDSAGWLWPCRWAGTLPELPVLSRHTNPTVPPWTGNSRSTFHSPSVLFALLVNPVCGVTAFTWTGTLPRSCFSLNLAFTWRGWVEGHEVCQIHSSLGDQFSPFLPFLPPKLQLVHNWLWWKRVTLATGVSQKTS